MPDDVCTSAAHHQRSGAKHRVNSSPTEKLKSARRTPIPRATLPGMSRNERLNCVFCQIVADQSPARVRYLDEEIIVIVNKLTWVPLMLLVMPKQHMRQSEMWESGLMNRMGEVAVDMGWSFAPKGFRILSNFGKDGLQSQSHAHLHIIGGIALGEYA